MLHREFVFPSKHENVGDHKGEDQNENDRPGDQQSLHRFGLEAPDDCGVEVDRRSKRAAAQASQMVVVKRETDVLGGRRVIRLFDLLVEIGPLGANELRAVQVDGSLAHFGDEVAQDVVVFLTRVVEIDDCQVLIVQLLQV